MKVHFEYSRLTIRVQRYLETLIGTRALTVQKESGRKKTLTKVRSLMFSPSRVAALLSITELALKS